MKTEALPMTERDTVASQVFERVVKGTNVGDPAEIKAALGGFYDRISASLNGSSSGAMAWFLNFGYVRLSESSDAVVEVPSDALGRNSIQLIVETIGAVPVRARDVLDVGCGRGGNVRVIDRFFRPKTITGLDLSATAIGFCRQHFASHRVRFVHGDAERLPFDDESFDLVVNVESSHSYPHVERFYAEVARVLRSGGHFAYTDLLPVTRIDELIAAAESVGLCLESTRDITPNVLRARDEEGSAQVGAYSEDMDANTLGLFLALPGTPLYEELERGNLSYRIWRFKRNSG